MAKSFKEINFKAKAEAVDKAFKEGIQIIAKDAVVTFQKNFALEGFKDETLESWKPRKGKINSLGAKAIGRKTLTKSGKLRRSIRYTSGLGGYRATVFTDLPYAEIHNEGLIGKAYGKYSFQMPKRKFMGRNRRLERMSLAKLQAKVKTACNNA